MVYNGKLQNPIKMDDLGVPLFSETSDLRTAFGKVTFVSFSAARTRVVFSKQRAGTEILVDDFTTYRPSVC